LIALASLVFRIAIPLQVPTCPSIGIVETIQIDYNLLTNPNAAPHTATPLVS